MGGLWSVCSFRDGERCPVWGAWGPNLCAASSASINLTLISACFDPGASADRKGSLVGHLRVVAMREIRRLQGCINDLIGVVGLSALWGDEPQQIVRALLNVLIRRLDLDFAAARLSGNSPVSSTELLRTASSKSAEQDSSTFPGRISEWLDAAAPLRLFKAPNPLGPGRISVVPFRFDLQGRIGTLVVASARSDFPTEIEMLVLRIAINQAAIALHEALRKCEQERIGMELEQRVALRTAELVAANRQLLLLKDELAAELQAMTRLHEFSTRLWSIADLPALLEELLTATIEIQDADFGNVQLYNPQLQRIGNRRAARIQRGVPRIFCARRCTRAPPADVRCSRDPARSSRTCRRTRCSPPTGTSRCPPDFARCNRRRYSARAARFSA